jgi:hypothetical protein
MKKQPFNPIIQTTYDYSKFKLIKGNRNLDQLHLRKIMMSMKDNPLLALVLVNDKMEIIDGQHRFFASKELKMPINYVIAYGYGVKEVQILNVNGKNWKKNDFLKGFVKEGVHDYVVFDNFQKEFPSLNFSTCLKLLSGLKKGQTTKSLGDGLKTVSKFFEEGKFVVHNLEESKRKAHMILDYKQFFPKFNDNSFIITLLSLFEHENYNHKEMINKLRLQPTGLMVCKTQEQYILLLESLYNYHRAKKVSFRY